ncbi:MAG: PAS domain S-box protein [Magnetococcales bacterium]|nr:PAS domain S-box protein [Magnetococcales bacterium]MBF0114585.1 PAS domain S-box protein [Magnetococcales bacterium]
MSIVLFLPTVAITATTELSPVGKNAEHLSLTASELSFLQGKNVRLGIDPSWPPFEFLDGQGQYAGIGADVVRHVSKYLRVDMTPEYGLAWSTVLEKIKKGELDLIPVVTPTEEKRQFLNFTQPYMHFPAVIVTRAHSPFIGGLEDLENSKFGLVKGYVVDEQLRRDRPTLNPVVYGSLEEGLRDVATGKLDAFIDNLASITWTIERSGLVNLKVAAPTPYRFELAMGVRNDWPAELVTALDKALMAMKEEEKALIKNRWLTIRYEYGLDPHDLKKWGVAVAMGSALLLSMALFYFRRLFRWNQKLQESEARFRTIIEVSPVPCALNDAQGNILYLNPAMVKTFGYSHEEIATLAHWWPLAYPDAEYRRQVMEEWSVRLTDSLRAGTPFLPLEVTIRCRDGSSKQVQVQAVELTGIRSHLVTLLDITESRKNENYLRQLTKDQDHLLTLLRQSEAKFRAFFDHVGIGMVHADPREYRILETNQSFAHMLGYSRPEELQGALIADLSDPEDVSVNIALIEQLRNHAIPAFGLEKRYRSRNGDTVWGRLHVTLVPGLAGEADSMVAAIENITSLRQFHSRLEESEARFRTVANSAPVLIWVSGQDKLYTWFNQRWLDFTGRSMEQEIGNGRVEGVHPEDFQRCLELYVSHFELRLPFSMTYRLRRHDGAWRWIMDNGSPRYDEHGTFAGYIGSCLDVTEQRATEQELQEQKRKLHLLKERYQRLFSDSPDAHLIMELADGRVSDCNRAAEVMLRGNRAQIIGQRPEQLSPPLQADGRESRQAARQIIQECIQQKQHRFEWLHRRLDGENFWAEVTVSLIAMEDREVLFVAWRDISDRKRIEAVLQDELEKNQENQQKLMEAKELAETANRAKSEFLAAMSHEIRTPMNVVIGMGDILLETGLNEQQQSYLRKQQSAGNTLLELINQILDLAKIESGKMYLVEEPLYLPGLLQELVDLLQVVAVGKGLQLHCRMDDHLPKWIVADRLRLRQVLFNLMSNAIKFTERGSVTLSARQKDADSLLLTVQDTGIGIDHQQKGLIFDRFSQADSSITRHYGGTGLGLTISRQLMEMMGGEILLDSTMGEGSKFYVILPLLEVSAPQPEPLVPGFVVASAEKSRTSRSLTILLAEDSEDNQILVQAFLKKSPHRLLIAANGREAVRTVQEQAVDLVFMDVQMPVMDGYTATHLLRQWETEQQRAPLPIIAFTAHALEGEAERSRQAGCNHHLTKPIKKKQLLEAIERFYPMLGATES